MSAPVLAEKTAAGVDTSGTMLAIERLFERYGPRDFEVRLWDGSVLPSEAPARCTIVLNSPSSLRRMLGRPLELRLGEAFVRGDWDVEGDIVEVFSIADHLVSAGIPPGNVLRLLPALSPRDAAGRGIVGGREARLRGARHSSSRDADAIRHHYDVGNDFYSLWLDRELVYSCGYWPQGCDDLDEAQRLKLDYICRKLRLRAGQRLLDIGCGWGALVRHAAREYGVEAVGITLSEPQAEEAGRRIAEEGLTGRAAVCVADYRQSSGLGRFDAVASVGMFEHVGREKLGDYFESAFEVLPPGGVFLNHGIAREYNSAPWSKDSFVSRYVFPDGELVPISRALEAAEGAGFEVRDVESMREHYARTLRHWVRRLEEARDAAVAIAGEDTYRIWRLYMAGSAHSFDRGYISVFQTLLVKPGLGHSGLPATRDDWYAEA